jgi:hypothetical protein
VQVIAGFSREWRPTDNPGRVSPIPPLACDIEAAIRTVATKVSSFESRARAYAARDYLRPAAAGTIYSSRSVPPLRVGSGRRLDMVAVHASQFRQSQYWRPSFCDPHGDRTVGVDDSSGSAAVGKSSSNRGGSIAARARETAGGGHRAPCPPPRLRGYGVSRELRGVRC